MKKEEFYIHLCEELRQNRSLYPYYKLIDGSVQQQLFRKAYFLQRLAYIDAHVKLSKDNSIWDCGCGYGTSCLYLAMNGQPTYGTTLEFYSEQIARWKQFWQSYGNTDLFSYEYANVFDQNMRPEQYDYIILQDTLHHIEPLDKALPLFYQALKKGGKIILIEENGGCLIKRAMLFKQRGFKRIISVYDDVLKKEVLMGNENIRSEQKWYKAFTTSGFQLEKDSVQYIRYFFPWRYKDDNIQQVIDREQKRANCSLLRHYAFFGLNMVFVKP